MTLRVAHQGSLDDSLTFWLPGEDIFERTNSKCHVFYILVCMNVGCLHRIQLIDHCVTYIHLSILPNILMPLD